MTKELTLDISCSTYNTQAVTAALAAQYLVDPVLISVLEVRVSTFSGDPVLVCRRAAAPTDLLE